MSGPKNCLRNREWRVKYQQDGFLLLPMLASELLPAIQNIYETLPLAADNAFGYSLMVNTVEKNIAVHEEISKILKPLTDTLFEDYRLLSSTFLTKPARFHEEMFLHQDWSFTHEHEFTPITLWIPLQGTNEKNGGIFVLPGSHLFFSNYRSYTLPTSRIPSGGLLKQHIKDINVPKGDVLLFDPGLFHGSTPNTTQNARVALTITVLPLGAPLIHVKKADDTSVHIHTLDDSTFLRDLRKLGQPEAFHGQSFVTKKYIHTPPTETQILKFIQP